MTKLYLLPLLLLSLCAYSQTEELPLKLPAKKIQRSIRGASSDAKPMVTCSADTIVYPYLKELVFSAPYDSFFVDAMVGNVRAASQAYKNTGTLTMKGIQFWGAAYTIAPSQPKTLQVQASVWSVDGFNMPVTELAATTVSISTEYAFYTAMFATPFNVTGNYAVVVKSVPSDTLAIIVNNANSGYNPVNYGEGLGWRRFGSGTWNSTISFFGQDQEYMIFPIVEYPLAPDFTMSSYAEAGSPVSFTNTSSGPLTSRFYNLYAFEQYWNLMPGDSSYTWKFGDGGTSRAKNPTHTYGAPGVYDVTLISEIIGYYTFCKDSVVKSLTVNSQGVTDTLLYPYHKELVFSAPNDSFFIDAMVGNVRAASQAYINTGTLTMKGIQFWGAAYTIAPSQPKTLQVQASVWSVDGFNMPVTELAATTVSISTEYAFYTAMFATPFNVTGNYAVVVKSVPSDTLAIMVNNANSGYNPVNYGEGLGWRRFGSGVWNSTINFFGQDQEYMIFPIVRYEPEASFSTDGTGTNTQPEIFTNTSSHVYSNRMINLNAFDKYWNLTPNDTTFLWNYGDGTTEIAVNGEHTYTNRGDFTVGLTARLRGYSTSNTDVATAQMSIAYALPVTLGRFTGEKRGSTNNLQWIAATEESMQEYVIERSADGRNFIAIGKVTALNRNQSRYQWTDDQPLPRSFYRLRMINSDGSARHSGVVLLTRDKYNFEVFTAGRKVVLVSEAAAVYTVSVYAPDGALLGRENISAVEGQQTLSLPCIEHAANGVYMVEVKGKQDRKTVRVIK